MQEKLIIANKCFNSRLMLGTGKYRNLIETKESIEQSKCEIVTVAVRRLDLNNLVEKSNLMSSLNWKKLWLLPNTAGAKTAEEAIRLAFLGRELSKRIGQENNNFVKLEVIADSKYLLPDPLGTIKAAEFLVKKGFDVLPYINADPILAKHLEDIGCATVMPLGSPIGSGQGIKNLYNIKIIIETIQIPVIIDAGIGTASDASLALEIGADGILVNTAIAEAKQPLIMAKAISQAVKAGYLASQAGRIDPKVFASPSSPMDKKLFL